jgi:hypothetical protein
VGNRDADDRPILTLFTSADGVAWTKKAAFPEGLHPSLQLAGGNIHLSYAIDTVCLKYVTGRLSADPASWITKSEVPVSGVSIANYGVAPSLALESAGNPSIAYWGEASEGAFNAILIFWKPAAGTSPAKVMDSQNSGSDDWP